MHSGDADWHSSYLKLREIVAIGISEFCRHRLPLHQAVASEPERSPTARADTRRRYLCKAPPEIRSRSVIGI